MIKQRIHHTFWCFNENSGDTGGLVYDNFGKWDEDKYALVEKALWQDDSGKFISLDHTIPLGKGGNGISLSDYYSGTTTPTAPAAGISGDANDDKAVDIFDSIAVRKYLADSTYTINTDNADMTGDGKVNSADLVKLHVFLLQR